MSTELIVQLVLGGFGLTGIVGAVIAVVKLRPDMTSQAVTQSQGAAASLVLLNERLEKERDYWKSLAETREAEVETLEEALRVAREERRLR